ncbi:hypothetical protein L7F22_025636 [Adiantum nelumboides]|nr:hypothetical protein [Adiantum nelumboides]
MLCASGELGKEAGVDLQGQLGTIDVTRLRGRRAVNARSPTPSRPGAGAGRAGAAVLRELRRGLPGQDRCREGRDGGRAAEPEPRPGRARAPDRAGRAGPGDRRRRAVAAGRAGVHRHRAARRRHDHDRRRARRGEPELRGPPRGSADDRARRRDPRRRHLGDALHLGHHGDAQGRDDLARVDPPRRAELHGLAHPRPAGGDRPQGRHRAAGDLPRRRPDLHLLGVPGRWLPGAGPAPAARPARGDDRRGAPDRVVGGLSAVRGRDRRRGGADRRGPVQPDRAGVRLGCPRTGRVRAAAGPGPRPRGAGHLRADRGDRLPPVLARHVERGYERTAPSVNYRPRARPLLADVVDETGVSVRDTPHVPGEAVYRSPIVTAGYYLNEEATREAFRGGWFHSGDSTSVDEDGLRIMVDRFKDIVKSGGENVSSLRVESVLHGHPAVKKAAVIGLPHPHWGEAVTAVVVLREGAEADAESIIAHCRATLGGYETPKAVVFVDGLPETVGGKVLKYRLRARHGACSSRSERGRCAHRARPRRRGAGRGRTGTPPVTPSGAGRPPARSGPSARGQQELLEVRAVEGTVGADRGLGEAVGRGVGVGVEGALLAAAGPEAAAGQLPRVALDHDPVAAVGHPARVRRRRPAGEAGARQVHAAPEEVHRADLADEVRPELTDHPVRLQQLPPEQGGRLGVVGGVGVVLGERDRRVDLVGVRPDRRGDPEPAEDVQDRAVELGDRHRRQPKPSAPPSLLRTSSRWPSRSSSISKAPVPYGTADVVSPRGPTYSVTCHQWLSSGAWAMRILPTIWVHMCRVSRVAVQSATRRLGQLVVVLLIGSPRGSAVARVSGTRGWCAGVGAGVPRRAPVAVGRDPAGAADHRGDVEQVVGHEREVAVGEVVLRAAGALVEVGRAGADLADPARVGLGRDGEPDVLQAVEDAHRAVLEAVLVAGEQAPGDAAVVGVLAAVVEHAGVAVEPLDHPAGHRAVVAEPDRSGDDQDVGGEDAVEQGGPRVGVPAVLGHVGADAGGDVVVDGADLVHVDPVRLHDRHAAVDHALGVAAAGGAVEGAVDVGRTEPGEVGDSRTARTHRRVRGGSPGECRVRPVPADRSPDRSPDDPDDVVTVVRRTGRATVAGGTGCGGSWSCSGGRRTETAALERLLARAAGGAGRRAARRVRDQQGPGQPVPHRRGRGVAALRPGPGAAGARRRRRRAVGRRGDGALSGLPRAPGADRAGRGDPDRPRGPVPGPLGGGAGAGGRGPHRRRRPPAGRRRRPRRRRGLVEGTVAAAGGNPLALQELPTVGRDPDDGASGEPMPVGPRLRQAFCARAEALKPATRALLLLAAAEGRGDRHVVDRAGAGWGVDASTWDEALRSGLLQASGAHLRFRHPLVPAALYDGAPSRTAGPRTARWPRRCRPRPPSTAPGTWRPPRTAPTRTSRRCWSRRPPVPGAQCRPTGGTHAAAGRRPVTGPADAARRLAVAARAAWDAGDAEGARRLLDDAERLGGVEPVVRCSGGLRGILEFTVGLPERAHHYLVGDMAVVDGTRTAMELGTVAARAAWSAGRPDLQQAALARLLALDPGGELAPAMPTLRAWWACYDGTGRSAGPLPAPDAAAVGLLGTVPWELLPPVPLAQACGVEGPLRDVLRVQAAQLRRRHELAALAMVLAQSAVLDAGGPVGGGRGRGRRGPAAGRGGRSGPRGEPVPALSGQPGRGPRRRPRAGRPHHPGAGRLGPAGGARAHRVGVLGTGPGGAVRGQAPRRPAPPDAARRARPRGRPPHVRAARRPGHRRGRDAGGPDGDGRGPAGGRRDVGPADRRPLGPDRRPPSPRPRRRRPGHGGRVPGCARRRGHRPGSVRAGPHPAAVRRVAAAGPPARRRPARAHRRGRDLRPPRRGAAAGTGGPGAGPGRAVRGAARAGRGGAHRPGAAGRPAGRRGAHQREIAARLLISHRTVGHHLGSVYPKLGVTSRAELARIDMAGDLRFRTTGGGE